MGRIPYEGLPSEYPPFLPYPPVEVEPENPDSFTLPTILNQEVLDIVGPLVEPIPEIPPLELPPPPPGFDPAVKSSAIGDIPFFGGQHGDIAIRGANGWIFLGAGTASQILKTQGTGANPEWADA